MEQTKKKPSRKSATLPNNAMNQNVVLNDPVAFGKILLSVAERTQPLIQEFFETCKYDMDEKDIDPMGMRESYMEFMQYLWANPQKIAEIQLGIWQDWMTLWQESTKKFLGEDSKELYEPEKGDKRFSSPLWGENALFDFIKQSYLLTSHWMGKIVDDSKELDEDTKKKIDFSMRQFLNAMAPTNFLLTNPEVIQATLDSKGENLVRGLENLIEDMKRGKGQLKISTTDYNAFKVGENIAITKGKVVYQNELMQLIQYQATTDKVFKRPVLIVPPWINKFYILDLQPENSYVKWLVEQGHTVFILSWVNPDKKLAQKRFENYMEEGVFNALEQIETLTGEPDCNVVGYCLGGTLLTMTLAWLAAKKQADRIASVTFLTTLIDFEHAGDMKLFMDDSQIKSLDKQMAAQGYLDADHLRQTFSLLRSNDLIWSFVVNNYLMGREPFPFDLLYWNDDSTNMPAAMHSFYIRKLYHDNLLVKPGGVTMDGVNIDINKIKTPCYFLSTKEDHIAPWQATYAGTQLLKGNITFTLAASGHVSGVVNPPYKNKYCYWTSDQTPADPEKWLKNATCHSGSWWTHWQDWIKEYGNGTIAARKIGSAKHKPLEEAPGSYVKMKAN